MLAFDNDVKYQLNPAITADHIATFLLTSVRQVYRLQKRVEGFSFSQFFVWLV